MIGIVALAAAGLPAHASDYRLDVGDVIEFSAVSMPEMRQRAPIGLDGQISFPLVGPVEAAGLSLSQLRRNVQNQLPTKAFRRRTPDGREYPVVVPADEITISVVEYRPVYLNGDVAKPGEQTFRPGMTVRQAIALAGGFDIMRFRMENPFLQTADLKSEHDALWAEYTRERARVARLKAELQNKGRIEGADEITAPLPASVVGQIKDLASRQLDIRNTDHKKEETYLRAAVKQEESRRAVLSEQQEKERQGTAADQADLDRLNALFEKGNVPITRVTEARRSILLSSTRYLQTTAELTRAERERGVLTRRLDKLDDDRQMNALAELQVATVALASLRARLGAVAEKMAYTGMIRSQLVRGPGAEPDIAVVRQGDQGPQTLKATQDTKLEPGDVVEVALKVPKLEMGETQ